MALCWCRDFAVPVVQVIMRMREESQGGATEGAILGTAWNLIH